MKETTVVSGVFEEPYLLDKLDWHEEGAEKHNIVAEPVQLGLHMVYFVGWAIDVGLIAFDNDSAPDASALSGKVVTLFKSRKFSFEQLLDYIDGKLTSHEFKKEFRPFAISYYPQFSSDLIALFYDDDADHSYQLKPSWEDFGVVSEFLQRTLGLWNVGQLTIYHD